MSGEYALETSNQLAAAHVELDRLRSEVARLSVENDELRDELELLQVRKDVAEKYATEEHDTIPCEAPREHSPEVVRLMEQFNEILKRPHLVRT